jgi:DNA-directed RNA polymerase specialized sigma24 family protein
MDPERAEAVVTATFEQARRTAATFLAAPGSVNAWLIDLANTCVRDGVGESGR